MAQALFIRETNGDHIILNQREEYSDVQIALMKQGEGLQRGGGVITGEELSGLVRGFLNRQGGMNITVTESMLNELGAFMVSRMEDANRWARRRVPDMLQSALSACLGMEKALKILGIPVERVQDEPGGYYTAVKIGDAMFPVRTE